MEGDPLAAYAQSDAITHNLTWHKQVRENEIRTSWFLRDESGITMVCTVDLSASKVTTSREVHDHASQSTKTRELSHAQVLTLRKLIEELPPSVIAPEFKNLVLVSVVENGTVKTRLYNRLSLPRNIVRLYDLTGAYVDMEDSHEADLSEVDTVRVLIRRAKARIDGTIPPASWPEKVRRVGAAWVVDIDTSRLPGEQRFHRPVQRTRSAQITSVFCTEDRTGNPSTSVGVVHPSRSVRRLLNIEHAGDQHPE